MCSEESCFLCRDNIFELHKCIGLPYNSAIVYEDENIFITPDISPICYGHFLIISQQHINSFGNAGDNVFTSIKNGVKFLTHKVYKTDRIMLLEHGAVLPHTAGACIDHAHIHVIPLLSELETEIDDFIHRSCSVLSDKVEADRFALQQFANNNQPYLFYATSRGAWAYPVQRLPNQFLRLAVANYTCSEYNWKLSYKSEKSKSLYLQTLEMAEHADLG